MKEDEVIFICTFHRLVINLDQFTVNKIILKIIKLLFFM